MPIPPGYLKFLEGNAEKLRRKCGLGAFARLDPFLLAREMAMEVFFVGAQSGLPADLLETVLGTAGGSWDAGTLKLPDGRIHVYMNPGRDERRQRSTLMEEISHIHLGHSPTEMIKCGGLVFRTCNKSHESQAYWLGAAALLPLRILKGARTRKMTQEELADEHKVSIDLVRFRCQINEIKLLAPAFGS
jgi:hypothetical protein